MLIRALASGAQLRSEESVSDRWGADDAFDPARQARYVLSAERLHVGLGTESLIEALLNSPESVDLPELPISDHERNLLAAVLMKDDEELSAEKIEGGVRALRRLQIRRRLEQIQKQLESMRTADSAQLKSLMDEKLRLKRALMNPRVTGEEITAASAD
jgi:hypothetical protein